MDSALAGRRGGQLAFHQPQGYAQATDWGLPWTYLMILFCISERWLFPLRPPVYLKEEKGVLELLAAFYQSAYGEMDRHH